jgi:hypothetical protein
MSGLWNSSMLTILAIQIRQDIVNATMVSRALVPSTSIPGPFNFFIYDCTYISPVFSSSNQVVDQCTYTIIAES